MTKDAAFVLYCVFNNQLQSPSLKYHSDRECNEEIIDICPLIGAMLELIDLHSSAGLFLL